ncbi:MAG: tRNA (guanosine(37)-N1)-methyltransferase TrmD [Candidatus Eisenbacteria bacterium]|nr:tRNA (guanosine(37)-N1)-methyltransferase TrmD [Candidatus Eisenbacteria bacterium]
MRIDVLTLFPEMFEGPLSESILRQAQEKGLLTIGLTNIRDFTRDKHRTADDYPYGGGSGMVMKPDPIFEATESVLARGFGETAEGQDEVAVILLSARGRLFDQALAAELATRERLVFICGRYKGVDERVTSLVTHEVSIGDYVLTGGELAAMVIVDAVARLVPGVLGDIESAETDSHFDGLLGPPTYTRPEEYRGLRVPDVLVSGNHERIRMWRRKSALRTTRERRPDLLDATKLSGEDFEILEDIEQEEVDE